MNKRLQMVIGGLVQGVWFRASTRDEALRLGLAGWVRNLPDGGVEVLAEGGEEALQRLAAWCRRGPAGARVDRVKVSWAEPTGEFDGFFVRR